MAVRLLFTTVGFARRDDSDDIALSAVTVAHDERSTRRAEPEQHETVFVVGVVRIVNEQPALVGESGLSFFE